MRLAGTTRATRATQHSLTQRMAYRILLNSTTTNELPTAQESYVNYWYHRASAFCIHPAQRHALVTIA